MYGTGIHLPVCLFLCFISTHLFFFCFCFFLFNFIIRFFFVSLSLISHSRASFFRTKRKVNFEMWQAVWWILVKYCYWWWWWWGGGGGGFVLMKFPGLPISLPSVHWCVRYQPMYSRLDFGLYVEYLVNCGWPFNTLRTRSFKLFKRPFPGFLTILTL